MSEKRYCIRCDQRGSTAEMRPLYWSTEEDEEPMWVHKSCVAAHLIAKMEAVASVIRKRPQSESSDPVVNLTNRRLLSKFAASTEQAAASSRELQRLKDDLERHGVDPESTT